MNTKRMIILMVVLVTVFTLGIGAVMAQGNMGNGRGNGYQGGRNTGETRGMNRSGLYIHLPAATTDELPQAVIDLMVDGWTDEQHAYAVYGSAIEQFGTIRPFTNIQRSEAQHIAAWETLFDRYGIVIPDVPTFDLPQFTSVTEACAVGADAEVANFDLYDAMTAEFEAYPDLLYVAQALRDASEFNHLPAFERCAAW